MTAKRNGRRPLIRGRRAISHDPKVIDWTGGKIRDGWTRERIVAASKAGTDGWPLSDRSLSNGGFTEVRAVLSAIEYMEGNGAAPSKRGPTPIGKRLYQVGQQRAAARKAGDPDVVLWDAAYEITKLSGLLSTFDVEAIGLDAAGLDMVNDLHDDMLLLQDWMFRSIGAVQARLGEQKIREEIAGLRAKTVENGCEVEEAASAQRKADRMERSLNNRIAA